MKPLVCVFAHPDDEAFGPAGTIAHFAKKRDVYIICCTHGDADGKFTKHNPTSLASKREKELLKSAGILRVKKVIFLNFKDGSLNNNVYHDLADAIIGELEWIKPDSILTFDINGISGHIDHIAVALVCTYVFSKTRYLKQLFYYRELENTLKTIRPNYFIHMPPGFKPSDCNFSVNTAPYWETRKRAMHAHESQREDADMILDTLNKHPKREYCMLIKK